MTLTVPVSDPPGLMGLFDLLWFFSGGNWIEGVFGARTHRSMGFVNKSVLLQLCDVMSAMSSPGLLGQG